VTAEQVREWAKANRKLLWNNHIWGEDGVFENRLTDIHIMPNLFIQAEHTAQVDKNVSRSLQSNFKDHTINILACSTTMEMGVNLGNLEVVLLTSVPPQPSNYKQRAGRSGRNNRITSACITLCGSDALGLRTLYNPIEQMIIRQLKFLWLI
jgi:DEAD/DEAH box helicase domain-containing protein